MQEAHVLNEVEPAPSSTLIREERTIMSKIKKDMASECFVDDIDFRILEKEHRLGAEKHRSVNADFFLADFAYNKRCEK